MLMGTNAGWARMVITIFTMAVFGASVCSTTCEVGVCPDQVQQTSSHDCDRTPSHHSDHSRHQGSGNRNCSKHEHPGLFVAKSGEFSQFQLTSHLNSTAAVYPGNNPTASITTAKSSEFTPPLTSSIPLYQQISVLRI